MGPREPWRYQEKNASNALPYARFECGERTLSRTRAFRPSHACDSDRTSSPIGALLFDRLQKSQTRVLDGFDVYTIQPRSPVYVGIGVALGLAG
jgi:hypothetical protein